MRRRAISRLVAPVMALAALLALGPLEACRRRPPGVCASHGDCQPGYDCNAGVCVRRPPAPGSQPSAPPPRVPVAAWPTAPPDDHREQPSPSSPPAPPPPPVIKAPPQSPPPPAPSPASPSTPMWKLRRKNS
jgi:hypothetical protein